ncbi:MAG TPA: phosphoketolase, partial [Nitrosomonas sp.]|nr:phosphoketolase [Nitrosomonas sp.]
QGYGWDPIFVEGDDPATMHQLMAIAMDKSIEKIKAIQKHARDNKDATRPHWPMIILNSPKGWTGPKVIDGKANEGNFRSHQVPIAIDENHKENVSLLESWMRSYRPEELFDESGKLLPEIAELAPEGRKRMGANVHANGGELLLELRLPEFRDYAVDVPHPSTTGIGNVHALGPYLRDVIKLNHDHKNFRIFGPDETVSNRLEAVFETTDRQWMGEVRKNDEHLSSTGAVLDSMLSEHQSQGWLEGYLLTGRHGVLNSYEAFIRIVDSMVNQHAKWIKMSSELPWRKNIASLNYLLTSHVWRQDHNG